MSRVDGARGSFEARLQQTRQAIRSQLGLRPDRAWILPLSAAAGGLALAGLLASAWREWRSRQRRQQAGASRRGA